MGLWHPEFAQVRAVVVSFVPFIPMQEPVLVCWPVLTSCMYSLTLKHTCIYMQVKEIISKNRSELLERRYAFPVGKLMGAVREGLKWADGKLVKEITEKQVKPSH